MRPLPGMTSAYAIAITAGPGETGYSVPRIRHQAHGMAVSTGTTPLSVISLLLAALAAPAAQAGPLTHTLAPVAEAVSAAVCIDPWHKARPCRPPTSLLGSAARQADLANRWLSSLWSVAGEVAAAPGLFLSGKRVACGGAFDSASLIKLDFTRFQLNMDLYLDTDEDRLDALQVAYRSCWR